ncbi:MAG: hypothetical protein M3Y39_18890 [Chloroflexota bacterium]|nr:hypothetical protein [Chloroflexota bacterium]
MGKLRPTTVEALAVFCEKAGLLAATIVRQRPEEAHTLAFALFHTIMGAFCKAVDAGHIQLRDSKTYYIFEYAWRPALKQALADLDPHISNDHPSLN